MLYFLKFLAWLILLPFRLFALAYASTGLIVLYLVGLGRAYIATIIQNIASNFFLPSTFELDKYRLKHTHILGATGSGKSSTLEFLIDQNIQKGQGLLLIEPHGELGKRVLHNARLSLAHSSQSYKKLVLLNFDESPPALNIFKLPLPQKPKLQQAFIDGLATELADAFCMNMKPKPSDAQFIMLRHIIMAGFQIENMTFMDMLKMLSSDEDEAAQYQKSFQQLSSPRLRHYFQTDFSSKSARRTKEALRLRLTSLIIPGPLYASLCAKECTVDFEAILTLNKYVIVKASAPLLGSYEAQTIGNLIVNLFNKYAFERLITGKACDPFFVYLDEAQHYINPSIQRGLTGVRKTGLNYTLAHQELAQEDMTPAEQRTIVHNTAVKMYGGLQWKDQKEAAVILGLSDPVILNTVKPGQFIIKAGNQEPVKRSFPSKFAVPFNAFGRGWFVNAYMKRQGFSKLSAYLNHKEVEKQPPAFKAQTDINEADYVPDKKLQNLSFKSFSLHGSKL
jgi:hypothetical protein